MNNVEKIAAKFQIHMVEALEVLAAVKTNSLDELSEDLYDVLYDFYVDNGEMPYEVASSGDPFDWIATKLTQELGIKQND